VGRFGHGVAVQIHSPDSIRLPAEAQRLGVYVHYPYCLKRCPYCDFTVTVRKPDDTRYRDAVLAELATRARDFEGRPPATSVYFGGGTPGLWSPACIGAVVEGVSATLGLEAGAEITVECNPFDLRPAHVAGLRAAGVNRLSVGVQSFCDRDLAFLGRQHRRADIEAGLEALHGAGFGEAFTLDLIHGMAEQTVAEAVADADAALAAGAPHVSTYQLTIEPRTSFGLRSRRGQVLQSPDGTLAEMFEAVRGRLAAGGVLPYEVSNAARPGHEAVHNGLYWSFAEYLGLGAGAHGFRRVADGAERWCNERHVGRYCEGAFAGAPRSTVERVAADALAEERVLVGLRVRRGLAVDADLRSRFGSAAQRLVAQGLLNDDGARWWATERGFALLDGVVLGLISG
jgi:oxygen-independent coproporphyrinogen-3 oxidase